MISSRFYFICYEVDAPLKLRYGRFCKKYKSENLTLEQFVEYDDKIKFNSEEFSLFSTSAEKQTHVRRRFHNKTDEIVDFY